MKKIILCCLLAFTCLFATGKKTVRIVAVGDVMLGTSYPATKYLPENVTNLLRPLQQTLASADVTFGNLEGCFSDSASPVKIVKDSSKAYLFRMPCHYAVELQKAGFDLMSIANNHSQDFGQKGIETTKSIMDSLGIAVAGTENYPTAIIARDSIRYGFCAFSANKGTLYINDYKTLKKIVSNLKEKADIVIVSFHGGAEGNGYQRTPDSTEIFLGENRGFVKEFARKAIDAGADLVLGHGPHVPRTIDLYKNRFIIYSLGNFCTFGRFNLRAANGIAPLLSLQLTPQGEFVSGKIVPIKQLGRGVPRVDSQRKVIRNMQKLLVEDAPNCGLQIDENGNITKLSGN